MVYMTEHFLTADHSAQSTKGYPMTTTPTTTATTDTDTSYMMPTTKFIERAGGGERTRSVL